MPQIMGKNEIKQAKLYLDLQHTMKFSVGILQNGNLQVSFFQAKIKLVENWKEWRMRNSLFILQNLLFDFFYHSAETISEAKS